MVALLNDLFGIQARGGCSCAGPYGHRLLAIDAAQSLALRDQLTRGWEGIKPGWTRVNFNYFISDRVCDYIIDAVDLVASYGHRLLTDYQFDPRTGLWRHHAGPAEPPLRLTDVRFGSAAPVIDPPRRLRAGEDVLDSHLLHARKLLMSRADIPDDADTRDHGAAGLPPESRRCAGSTSPPSACAPHQRRAT